MDSSLIRKCRTVDEESSYEYLYLQTSDNKNDILEIVKHCKQELINRRSQLIPCVSDAQIDAVRYYEKCISINQQKLVMMGLSIEYINKITEEI